MSDKATMKFDMVFEGGGAKGMIFVGAMERFEAANLTFNRLVGSSAGAITAVLLAAGYTAAEMLDALEETVDGKPVFATFMSRPRPFTKEEVRESGFVRFLRNVDMPFAPDFIEDRLDMAIANALAKRSVGIHLFSLIDRGGLFAADNFVTWLERKLEEKLGDNLGKDRFPDKIGDVTMAQFFEMTGREVTVTGSDVTDNRLLFLNRNTAPDLPIVWAVRMSMSIPLLWEEVIWQSKWGNYHPGFDRDPISLTKHAIVDGGLLSNFPIELLVSDEPQVTAVMGGKQSSPVIGLLIDDGQAVENAPAVMVNQQSNLGRLLTSLETVRRIRRIIDTVTSARDKLVIEAFKKLVVRLPSGGYGTTEFGMSDARREALVNSGRVAMQAHLDRPVDPREFLESTKDAAMLEKANRRALDILAR